MNFIIGLFLYLAVGVAIVQSTLYISKYELGDNIYTRFKILGLASIVWPIFVFMMFGFWGWTSYHQIKHWVKGYI